MAIHRALPLMIGQFLNFNVIGSSTQPTNPKDNTIWVNTATKIHHWSLNGKEPARVSNNKNLITYPYYCTSAFTTYGVTFTPASTGYITVNGTNSNTNYITCYIKHLTQVGSIHLSKGTYRLSGCPSGGSSSTYRLECAYSYNSGNNWTWIAEYGSGAQFTLTADAWVQVKIRIEKGITMNSLVFKPQLEKGETITSFVKGDATGQVWIKTLNSAGADAFNALKTNMIDIQLDKAYQWNGSKWNELVGKVYSNGTFVQISGFAAKYIYNNGTQNYTFGTVKTGSGSGGVTYNSTNMYLTATGSYSNGGYFASASTTSKIDVTSYSKLHVVASGWAEGNGGKTYENANHFCAGLLNSRGASTYQDAVYKMNLNGTNSQQTFELDISKVTGSYYISVGVSAYRMYDYSNSGYVYQIWLD